MQKRIYLKTRSTIIHFLFSLLAISIALLPLYFNNFIGEFLNNFPPLFFIYLPFLAGSVGYFYISFSKFIKYLHQEYRKAFISSKKAQKLEKITPNPIHFKIAHEISNTPGHSWMSGSTMYSTSKTTYYQVPTKIDLLHTLPGRDAWKTEIDCPICGKKIPISLVQKSVLFFKDAVFEPKLLRNLKIHLFTRFFYIFRLILLCSILSPFLLLVTKISISSTSSTSEDYIVRSILYSLIILSIIIYLSIVLLNYGKSPIKVIFHSKIPRIVDIVLETYSSNKKFKKYQKSISIITSLESEDPYHKLIGEDYDKDKLTMKLSLFSLLQLQGIDPEKTLILFSKTKYEPITSKDL